MAKLPEPIYNLIDPSEEILHTELETFDFSNPPIDPVLLASDLHYTMAVEGGVGLSANQVGLPYRVFVVNSQPALTMYNPRITWYDTNEVMMQEGCLSYPKLVINIKRPDKIRIRYQNEKGEVETKLFEGMVSRVCQHELDHLNGVDFTQRASELSLKRAKEKLKKLNRKLKKRKIA